MEVQKCIENLGWLLADGHTLTFNVPIVQQSVSATHREVQ